MYNIFIICFVSCLIDLCLSVVEIISKIMIEKELLILFIEEMMKVKVLKILKVKNEEDHLKIKKKMNLHQ
jgi:hypothetical protein